MVLAMGGETLFGLVDTKLVSGIGRAALSGVGVATTLMWLCYSFAWGIARGVKVRVAYAIGEERPQDCPRYAIAGALLAAMYGSLVLAAGRNFGFVFELIGLDPEAVPYAETFFRAVTCGAPLACVSMALVQHRQGMSDSRTPMIVTLFGNALNGVLGYCLIYGKLGFPALGVAGGGYATAIAQSINAAFLIALLVRDRRRTEAASTTSVSSAPARIAFGTASREVLRVGTPTGAQFLGEALAFSALTLILGSISAVESAAHQIGLAVARVSFLPGLAIGEAACVLVGQSLGRKRRDEASNAVSAALHLAMAFMTLCGVVFVVFGRAIALAFTTDPLVVRIVTNLLLLAGFFQLIDGVNLVYRSALRGAEDVKVPAYAAIAITWICMPLAAHFLGRVAGWGAVGAWCGFLAEATISAAFFGWRWRRLGFGRRAGKMSEAPNHS